MSDRRSLALFPAGAALHLVATTSMGIFMATLARSMRQFGMLLTTPRESMPQFVQDIIPAAPTTHFVELGQSILCRGTGIGVVWQPFLALIGSMRSPWPAFARPFSQMA